MRLRVTIEGTGKTAAGIEIPPEVVASLGSSRRPAVRVTINGYTYRSSIASMGGRYLLGVSNETRDRTGVAAGDEIEVDIELDTEPREVELPDDFEQALAMDAEAKRFFEGLNYSNKRRLVGPINDAKTPETRERRIASTIARLHEGRA
jgi:Bacteriocin-protection, YdeI or OmpD-Associated/Domain of unknown function (DUF1905)